MSTPPVLNINRSIRKALKLFDTDRFRWLDEATAAGPLVGLRMGPVTTWVVTDAELARTMLLTDAASWRRPPATIAPIRLGGGENLFTQSDKAWTQLQPFVAPAFRKKALDARLAQMDALIDDEVRAIPLDETIDLELAMGRIVLILAAWVLLGERLDRSRAEEIAHHQREVVRWVGARLGELTGFLPFAPGERGRVMKRHRAALNAYADEVIARARRTERADDDVLGALLTARPGGRALAAGRVAGPRARVVPRRQRDDGCRALVGARAGSAQPGGLGGGSRRRRRPHGAVPHRDAPREPCGMGYSPDPSRPGIELAAGGVSTRVRRGQLVTVYLRGLNRDPEVWREPTRFDPSRHCTETTERPRALLPFGLGPRGCIGQHLAMAEMSAVLPALTRHGNVTIDGDTAEDPGFALRVAGGLKGRFTSI